MQTEPESSGPVTVSIARRVVPGREADYREETSRDMPARESKL